MLFGLDFYWFSWVSIGFERLFFLYFFVEIFFFFRRVFYTIFYGIQRFWYCYCADFSSTLGLFVKGIMKVVRDIFDVIG